MLTACGGDLALPEQPGTPPEQLSIARLAGDSQEGIVGQALPAAVSVRIVDTQGQAVSAARVAFVPTDSAPGSVVPDTSFTDGDGRASARWVLGPHPGEQSLTANVVGGATDAAVSFVATAEPGLPARIKANSGDGQRGPIGQPLPDSLVVLVTDQFGNPVSGVGVEWRVEGGGGRVSARASTTGADGLAAVQWTLGGNFFSHQEVSATVAGLTGSPVIFTASLGT
jgi:hypothetical protein